MIIPNYNHARYLKQRIDSVLNQTYHDFELILLDDNSSDNSREVLDSYRGNEHVTQVVFNEKNGGTPFKQWDKGIELASGDWIWIAESDDFADIHFLECLMGKIQEHPNVGLAFSSTFFVNENGAITGKSCNKDVIQLDYCVHSSNSFIKERLFIRNTIDNVSECIFKKSLYCSEKKQLYEWMNLCGDWLFYVLLAEQADVLEVFEPLSYYRKHSYNTVITTERDGKTFQEGIEVYKYIDQNVVKAGCTDYKKMAKYWLQNKKDYHYSKETNNSIKRLFRKEFPMVVVDYCLLSFWRKLKNLF